MIGAFSEYFEHGYIGYTSMSQLESCTDIAGPAQPSSAPEVMTDLGWPELQLRGGLTNKPRLSPCLYLDGVFLFAA